MNSSGVIRGMISKNDNNEKFLLLVGKTIEKQLRKWDQSYQVKILEDLLGEKEYIFLVQRKKNKIEINLKQDEITLLRESWPYALDQYIWQGLKSKGLRLGKSDGNYLKYCSI